MRRRSHLDKIWADGIEVGEENAELVARGESWCQHLRISGRATGLITQMTGLPVGLLELSCRHAKGTQGAGRLSWALPDFLWEQCRGCEYHTPNGDTSWGEGVIREKAEAEEKAAQRKAAEEAELVETRAVLRESVEAARKRSRPEEQRVAELAEVLFGDDSAAAIEKSRLLVESAKVAADLFPAEVAQILLKNSKVRQFSNLCRPVVIELSRTRSDLAPALLDLARHLVAETDGLEAGSQIALSASNCLEAPVPDAIVREVCIRRSYQRFPGGSWDPPEADRSASTLLLKQSVETSRKTILEVINRKLAHESEMFRGDGCELISRLLQSNSSIGLELLPQITASLHLEDDSDHGSADGAACASLARLFAIFPNDVEEHLGSALAGGSQLPELRCKAYRMLFLQLSDRKRAKEAEDRFGNEGDLAFDLAFRQCLRFISDSTVDSGVRNAAVEAVAVACGSLSEAAAAHGDALVGALALVCSEEGGAVQGPRVLKPGQPEQLAELQQLEQMNLEDEWKRFRSSLGRCVEELARKQPQLVADTLLSTLETMGREGPEELRARLVVAAGQLGRQDLGLLARALPSLMTAAMDFESALVRLRGIEALETAFRNDNVDPPSNVGQAILLHLRDPVIGVHQAAMTALGSRDWGLTSEELREALGIFAYLLDAYRGDPSQRYKLERLSSTFLHLARVNKRVHSWAIARVLRLLPTGDPHHFPDKDLCEVLAFHAVHDDPVAPDVARAFLSYLGQYPRELNWNERYEQTDRHQLVVWLHGLPLATLTEVADEIEACARAIAGRDPWEVLGLASLAGKIGLYELEADLLESARVPIQEEESWKEVAAALRALAVCARANDEKAKGRHQDAQSLLSGLELGYEPGS